MSASLVGSEMCIRDRPYSVAWGFDLSGNEANAARARRAARVADSSTDTVSYTHLTLPTICSV
eukprot:778621-Alexandrium_andersonii.AAC.1